MSAKDLPQVNFRLEEKPYAKLRLIAARENTSLSALLREGVDRVISSRDKQGEWLEEGVRG